MDVREANLSDDAQVNGGARRTSAVRFGPFELNPATSELREHGVLRRLPPQPFRVLRLLVEHAGETVARADIQHCLWGNRTHVEVDRGINFCMNQIRAALRDPAEASLYIKTLPRRGYCFVGSLHTSPEPAVNASLEFLPPVVLESTSRGTSRWRNMTRALVLVPFLLFAGDHAVRDASSAQARNAVVIGDFVNETGDGVFDDTLQEALSIEMRQSPFFEVLPDAAIYRTLKAMGQSDARLTPQLALTVCQHTGSAALLEGKIASLGAHFMVSVDAIDCAGGAVLASEQSEAQRKEDVLAVVGKSASRLRKALGESLASLRKFDSPMEATTKSLEALKSYKLGRDVALKQGDAPSLLFFQRAIELDPDLLVANVALAAHYANMDQPSSALHYATRGYELRDRGPEIERLRAMQLYYRLTGNLQKLTQVLNMWASEYPRDPTPHGSLGANFMFMGQFDKAADEWQQALQRNAGNVSMYENLAFIYMALGRPTDARAILESAWARELDGSGLRLTMYMLAFRQDDRSLMDQQLQWAVGKPGAEDMLLAAQAETEAYHGRLASARNFSQRAVTLAYHTGLTETAALWQVLGALREAEFGEAVVAKKQIAAALALDGGRNVRVLAALALARSGDAGAASALADQLEHDEPDNTALQMLRLPSIRAAAALAQEDPTQALQILELARPYELGFPSPSGHATLYPVYLRGIAYLALRKPKEAASEFRKIIEHPGIALNSPVAILARLDEGRAAAMSGDWGTAHRYYEQFLSAWANADPDVSILATARAEQAQLGR